jgi:2-polyprenyl-3-methyl-5-hydroxy-6-metoxy-1,4-benzoquinol methylase
MPWSSDEGKHWARDRITELNPTSVLDVGAGSGTYGRIVRELCPTARVDAVEIWRPYVTRFDLNAVYDTVTVADARNVTDFGYSLVIFGDVLEHLPLTAAVSVVRRARAQAGAVLVAAPIVHWEQGAAEGNPHEAHLHHFVARQLFELVGTTDAWCGEEVGYFMWTSPSSSPRSRPAPTA